MKLIDLLVQELPKRGGWPEGAEIAVQDADSQICFSSHSDVYANKGKTDWYGGDWGDGYWSNPFIDTIADDRHECIVSRNQYESALAASKAVVGHNGWIEWHGGECPVDSDAIVEVKYRRPKPYQYSNDRAGDFSWAHDGIDGDIIAYRLHNPEIKSRANDDRLEHDLNECIGQGFESTWNGDGLPPVGCECECHVDEGIIHCVVVGYDFDGKAVVMRNVPARKYFSIQANSGRIKPLRTEAERKRDAAIEAMQREADEGDNWVYSEYEIIYDSIAAGKIPGVKLED